MLQCGMGSGHKSGQEIRKGLNGMKGLIAKVLHLAHGNRSPNWDQELSAGELNGTGNRSRKG